MEEDDSPSGLGVEARGDMLDGSLHDPVRDRITAVRWVPQLWLGAYPLTR